MSDLDEFYDAYIEAALWSTNDESDERGGVPLDDNYGPEDIEEETAKRMRADCERFITENKPFLAKNLTNTRYGVMPQAGHDFWLTRCGHGCGFNDGDWQEPADSVLTRASQAFGEFYLCVGDDGKIYGN